jgi:branched-chain amino acid transport system permease protein
MRASLFGPRNVLVVVLLGVLAVLPLLTDLFSQPFYLSLATRFVILAMAATSLNLILGYGGMVSFGHAAFLGIGAYSVGIPAYYDVTSGWVQFPVAVATSAAFALVTGAISLRTRGVYFIMITMAFAQMVYFGFVSIEEYGGDDGLVIYSRSTFSGLANIENAATLYYFCFACLVATIFLVHRMVNSRFGMVIKGARENERRMQAIGFNTYAYKLVCYVISGAICGFAGALLANFSSFISPAMIGWTRSGELIFMVVLGGTGALFGPLLGTSVYLVLEEVLSGYSKYWQLPFGVLLILVVLFARGGIDGMLRKLGGNRE